MAEDYNAAAEAPATVNPTVGASQTPPTGPPSPETIQQQNQALRDRLNSLPLPPEEVEAWWKRIEESEQQTKEKGEKWDVLLQAYMPVITAHGTGEEVRSNGHFRNIHTKIGQVFVKSPKVLLEARGLAKDKVPTIDAMTGMPKIVTAEEAVLIKQSVINEKMSAEPGCINGLRLMDECLFDSLAWAGIACVKIGYRVVVKTVPEPAMMPDPNFVPPPIEEGAMGLTEPQAPMVPDPTQPPTLTEVPIYEEWYAERFSPKKLLLPCDLKTTRYSRATWKGMKFYMSKRQAQRNFGLTEADLTATSKDEDYGRAERSGADNSKGDMVEGYEIWYQASCFTDELHPDAVNQLVLIKGYGNREMTVISRKSPDQTFDELGRLTADSLIGQPILVMSLRDLADSAFPLADTAYTNSQVKFQDTFLRQGVKLRDAQIGKYIYDAGAFETGDLEQLKNGEVGEFIAASQGKMMNGLDKIFAPTNKIQGSNDDYRMSGIIKQFQDETLGISSTQAGAPTSTVRSATEIQDFQSNSQGRQKKERDRAVEFYISIVRAIDTLVTRYATGDHYTMVQGIDGSKKIEMWNEKLLQSAPKYSYSIKTDSQLDNDVARDRQQMVGFLNVAGPDPLVNRAPIYRELAPMFGIDPFEIILSPEQLAMGGLPPVGGGGKGGPTDAHEAEKSGGKPNAPGSQGAGRGERNPGVSEGKGKPPV